MANQTRVVKSSEMQARMGILSSRSRLRGFGAIRVWVAAWPVDHSQVRPISFNPGFKMAHGTPAAPGLLRPHGGARQLFGCRADAWLDAGRREQERRAPRSRLG